jgi:predicted dehydrogenase
MKPVKVGVIGCGDISGQYLRTLPRFSMVEVVACASRNVERARSTALKYGIATACTPGELVADPAIELVVNLTPPAAHHEITLAALDAGKHVYTEKPLAVTRDQGRRLLELAASNGLRLGCAPDTVLGGAHQTCRKLIDGGAIGEPVAATAFMLCRGHEHWHPSPAFYYKQGGGPLFDMGPYYLGALVMLLGPIRRVTASARTTFPTRTITSRPLAGHEITVEVPTHVAGILDFECGAVATLITSFDVRAHTLPRIELYGATGTMSVPDPNRFGGVVRVTHGTEGEWEEPPLSHPFTGEGLRGLGVADMAEAIRTGRPHRAGGETAYHILDTMHACQEASKQGRHVVLDSRCSRPAPLRADASFERLG